MTITTRAECCDGVEERAAQHDEVGTGGNRLGNVQTGPYAAVDDQRHLAANYGTDVGKLVKRVRRRIELAATMVRDHQTVNARAHGALGVLPVQDALEKKFA